MTTNAAYTWTCIMPGVYAPVRVLPAPETSNVSSGRTRPAWFPRHIVRRRIRRYRICDAARLPY